MAALNDKFKEVIKRCKVSPTFFIESFGRVRHPKAGVIPFKPFEYQKESVEAFRKNRFVIYKKTRQCGISTVVGIYALWYAMFHPHVTILIVSKRDQDAVEFMTKNVQLPYKYLPSQFRDLWRAEMNQHEIRFKNGSYIQCKPSGADTLRSYSSTLNIVDEAAFMPNMDEMWTGAAPIIAQGSSVIVISTTNGKGNWYYETWEGAISQENKFFPLEINWWEMTWTVKYKDDEGNEVAIEPTKDIRECTPEEKTKYGPYWSPWLENQYAMMREKGEERRFRQEVLADFVGSGNTVIDTPVLLHIEKTRNDNYRTVGSVNYHHPVTEQQLVLDFQNQFWVWKTPVGPKPDTIENGRVIKPGTSGHVYSIGVDVSTGEASDYSAVVVFDVTAQEQVAEMKIKVQPSTLTLMIDYIARYYNSALLIIERTGIGAGVAQDIESQVGYYNVYRQRLPNGNRNKKAGFPTNGANKALIDKALMDTLGEDGFSVYSHRLYKELGMYVYLNDGSKTGAEPGPGNNDDLVIACGLALIGVRDAIMMSSNSLVPVRGGDVSPVLQKPTEEYEDVMKQQRDFATKGGAHLLMPISHGPADIIDSQNPEAMLYNFAAQLGGLTKDQALSRMPGVINKKNVINKGHKRH